MSNRYTKADAVKDLNLLGLSPESFVEEKNKGSDVDDVYEALINEKFRKIARANHTDRGGDINVFQALSNARDRLLARDVLFHVDWGTAVSRI